METCTLGTRTLNEEKEFWDSILWPDESKFNLFGSDRHQIVWRQPHESMKPECLKPTVKYGGGSVMVWVCMASNGVGNLVQVDGIMYKEQYERILEEFWKKILNNQRRSSKCDRSFSNTIMIPNIGLQR